MSDVTIINLDTYLFGFVVLYPVTLLSVITCHSSIMEIKLMRNVRFLIDQEVRCPGGDGHVLEVGTG